MPSSRIAPVKRQLEPSGKSTFITALPFSIRPPTTLPDTLRSRHIAVPVAQLYSPAKAFLSSVRANQIRDVPPQRPSNIGEHIGADSPAHIPASFPLVASSLLPATEALVHDDNPAVATRASVPTENQRAFSLNFWLCWRINFIVCKLPKVRTSSRTCSLAQVNIAGPMCSAQESACYEAFAPPQPPLTSRSPSPTQHRMHPQTVDHANNASALLYRILFDSPAGRPISSRSLIGACHRPYG
jgi:hypothetical protein